MIGAFFDLVGTIYRGVPWRDISERQKELKRNRFWVWAYLIWHMAGWPLNLAGLLSKRRWYYSWARDMSWLVRGLTVEDGDELFDWLVEERIKPNLRTDIMEILRGHQAQGHVVALVSGSPQQLLDAVASSLGIEHVLGTPLEIKQGRYTGKMAGPVTMNEGKAVALQRWAQESELEIDWRNSFAYGDGHGDIDLLEMVGHPVAVYPDEGLRAAAEERGWRTIGEREPHS